MYGNNNYGGYNNYPSAPYYGYTSPYQPQVQAPQQVQAQPQPQQNSVVNTNKLYAVSIDDVRTRQLPNNSDYIFLDNDRPIIYRKTTDSTGKMTVQAFKIIPYEEDRLPEAPQIDMSQYVLQKDFEALKTEIARLRSMLKPNKKQEELNESTK